MDTTETRRCNRCNQSKSVADFYLRHGKPQGWCKQCYRDWHRARYTPKVPVSDHHTCVVCGTEYQTRFRCRSLFCSQYCRNQAHIAADKAMRADRAKEYLESHRCENCGGPLPNTRRASGRKFCGDDCQQKAARARRAPGSRAAYRFLKKYGITIEQRSEMLTRQGGGCAVCQARKPGSKGWVVDHDHACCSSAGSPDGKTCGNCIRGILCQRCNLALGLFEDDPDRLRSAIKYLKRKRKS